MNTITNLQALEVLNVNIYEIENSALIGDSFYKTFDNTFFIMSDDEGVFRNYKLQSNEVLLNTKEGICYLIKKV